MQVTRLCNRLELGGHPFQQSECKHAFSTSPTIVHCRTLSGVSFGLHLKERFSDAFIDFPVEEVEGVSAGVSYPSHRKRAGQQIFV